MVRLFVRQGLSIAGDSMPLAENHQALRESCRIHTGNSLGFA